MCDVTLLQDLPFANASCPSATTCSLRAALLEPQCDDIVFVESGNYSWTLGAAAFPPLRQNLNISTAPGVLATLLVKSPFTEYLLCGVVDPQSAMLESVSWQGLNLEISGDTALFQLGNEVAILQGIKRVN